MKKRILISVTDKTGIEKFKRLTDIGWEIISTGGTAEALEKANIPCTPIETVTGFPEMMDGRLKTIHPNIFGGILADRSKDDHLVAIATYGIELIDMVVVNLYDFEGKPGIENIDIGGPSLLRAAAKNGLFTIPLCDPNDYDEVINAIVENGDISLHKRKALVVRTFLYTANYEKKIAEWMDDAYLEKKNFLQSTGQTH